MCSTTVSLFTNVQDGKPIVVIHRYKELQLKVGFYTNVTRSSASRLSNFVVNSRMALIPFKAGGVGWTAKD